MQIVNEDRFWEILKYDNFVNDEYDEQSKKFIMSICQNNLEYVKNNYINIKDKYMKTQMFTIAVAHSNSASVVKFLIDVFEIDLYYDDHDLNQIDLNFNDLKITITNSKDPMATVFDVLNKEVRAKKFYLHLACFYNSSLEIIKFLIKDLKMNPGTKIAHRKMIQLPVPTLININEVIDLLNILASLLPPSQFNDRSDSSRFSKLNNLCQTQSITACDCLMLSCISNTNIFVIKYLIQQIEEKNLVFDYIDYAIQLNPNLMLVKYLIEKTNLEIKINTSTFIRYIQILPLITENYDRFNELLNQGISKYDTEHLIRQMDSINPLIIDDSNMKLLRIRDPYTIDYTDFINLVDSLIVKIPFPSHLFDLEEINEKKTYATNISYEFKELFEHNNKIYSGDRRIVCDSMYLFNDIDLEYRELPVLTAPLSEHILKMYIQSCYDHWFCIDNIDSMEDFKQFLKFIDQYPTKIVSIDKLEKQIVKYLYKNKILCNYDQYIKDLCTKYQLKYLHLYIKQKYRF